MYTTSERQTDHHAPTVRLMTATRRNGRGPSPQEVSITRILRNWGINLVTKLLMATDCPWIGGGNGPKSVTRKSLSI
jgi:hypothetical protein